MIEDKEEAPTLEFKTKGTIIDGGVRIAERSNIDALSQRGYGIAENNSLTLKFYEALFLLDKQMLSIKNEKGTVVDFQSLLHIYEAMDDNAWMHYLIYRDLRSRGYVVREGFGVAVDFRIYERGAYGKGTATALIVSTQEGKPLAIEDLTNALSQTQSLKKDLVLAVINRRGEIVYYSVAPLTFK